MLSYFTISKGVNIGPFEAFGIAELKEENDKIDGKLSEASMLTSTEYPQQLSELNKNAKTLLSKKEEYTDLTTYSTEEQVEAANELDDYKVEYLWVKVGNYATKEGITLKMDIKPANNGIETSDGRKMYDLFFTAEGSYVGIALFLSDIEDDSFLEFKIENFAMTGDENKLKATFVVKDIPVNIENMTQNTASSSDTTNANNTNKNTTTNTTNTTSNTTNTTNTKNTTSNTTK